MKLIAYYAVYNEADFLEYSIRSVIPHVDHVIVIEGAWKETYEVNGHQRSKDGTCEILRKLQKEFGSKLQVEYRNMDSQLEQRTEVFNLLPRDKTFQLLLVDGDEVWTADQIQKLRQEDKSWETGVVHVKSLIFINDFEHVSEVVYPRMWVIRPDYKDLKFVEPNRISVDGGDFLSIDRPDIHFFHYSYCHSPERFQEKKRERTRLHGNFAWELRDGLVQRDDANIQIFEGEHPEIMKTHPLFGLKRHRQISPPERIVFVEHSGIGNLVLATPLLKALRATKPNAHIEVVTWKRASRILEGHPAVDLVINTDDNKWISHYQNKTIDHLLVSPVGAIDVVAGVLRSIAKKCHQVNVGGAYGKHEAEYKMNFARNLGYRGPTPDCEVTWSDRSWYNINWKYDYTKKFIAICPGYLKTDHWHLKHWGNQNYASLIHALHTEYPELEFVFLGDKSDRAHVENIEKLLAEVCLPETFNLCGEFSDIKDVAALLSKGVLSIGNDGGLQHIAAAVGTPTVTIFTFTNPIKNKPLSKKGKLVMTPCEHRITCQHGNWSKCEQRGCLNVHVAKVLQASKEVLNETTTKG